MGYVDNKSLQMFIPSSQFICDLASTWSYSGAGDTPGLYHEATGTLPIYIPVVLPQGEAFNKGAKVKSIDVYYKVDTAALTSMAAPVTHVVTLPANGSDLSAAAVDNTLDTGHDAAAERITVASHTLTITLDTPIRLGDDQYLLVELSFVGSASSELFVLGAKVNYELRL
jgi:hypothetical protein